ncbi:MAG TPA: hypothetical protein VL986_08480 [Terracidiphilus sp.]|nr:hypothetical protein [Terracidiphilus sp.]
MSLDDSTLDVADEKIIEDALSRLGASRGASAYPQIRFVSLVENGTHVLFCSQTEGCRTGEIRLPKVVLPHLKKGMLCLADRNFFGFELWQLRSRLARRQQFCIAVGSVRASPFTLCAIYNAIQFLLGLRKTGFPAQRNAEVVFMPGQFVSVIGARKFGWRLIVLVGGILNVSSLHSSGDTV